MLITHPQAPRADLPPMAARRAPAAPLPMTDAAAGPAAPAHFASLLRQQQAAPAERPAATPMDAPDDTPAAPAADAAEPEPHEADAATAKPRNPTRLKARGPDKPAVPGARAAAGPADAARPTHAAEPDAARQAADPASPTMDPALAAWLAALHAAPVAPAVDARSAAQGPAQGIDDPVAAADGANPAGTRSHGKTDLSIALADKADKAERAAHALAESDAVRATTMRPTPGGGEARPALAELAGAQQGERQAAPTASGVAAFSPAPTTLHDVAPPPTVLLPTPLDAPDFSHALGLQVSMLAKGGIQQAELQLNPADMGPVSVQIVMDGTRAQVDFGADLAATRHAIEAGMPALASALRDAGFTLAGGGVSQHSRGRGDNGDAREQKVNGTRSARRLADAAKSDIEAAARTITRRTVRLGGLDLYA